MQRNLVHLLPEITKFAQSQSLTLLAFVSKLKYYRGLISNDRCAEGFLHDDRQPLDPIIFFFFLFLININEFIFYNQVPEKRS
jgi:hypothetical protein